jgi:hypothetical protein
MGDSGKPDWEHFEPYKGPEEKPRLPEWAEPLFRLLLAMLVQLGVFLAGGSVLVLMGGGGRRCVHNLVNLVLPDPEPRFWVGGIIALAGFVV